jgi:hypothetical protein
MADPTKAWDVFVRVGDPNTLAQDVRDAIQAQEAAGFVAMSVTSMMLTDKGVPAPGVLIHFVEQTYTLGGAGLTADLASTAAGKGATLVAVRDAAGRFTGATVEAVLLEIDQRTVEALHTNAADSAAVANTAVETDFDKTYALPAGTTNVGDFVEIDFSVLVNGAMTGAGNLTIIGYVGTQVVYSSGAYAAAQNDYIAGKLRVRLRAGATSVVEEDAVRGAPGTAVPTHKRTTGLTIDPTAANTIKLSATFANAHAANACTLKELTVRAGHVA